MAPDTGGEGYPWGTKPWPGTEGLKKEAKDHPGAVDGFWFDKGHYDIIVSMLKARRSEIGASDIRKHLTDAAGIEQKDVGQWAAARSLFSSTQQANSLMVQAYDNFLKAFDAVIDRLDKTSKTNTGVEVDNYESVTFNNVLTIDPTNASSPSTSSGTPVPGSYS
jgi:hypothetical protein